MTHNQRWWTIKEERSISKDQEFVFLSGDCDGTDCCEIFGLASYSNYKDYPSRIRFSGPPPPMHVKLFRDRKRLGGSGRAA